MCAIEKMGFCSSPGKPLIIDMERVTGNIINHETRIITIFNGGRQTSSINGSGVILNGVNQYIDVGGGDVVCGGKLEDCQRGFTLRFKVCPPRILIRSLTSDYILYFVLLLTLIVPCPLDVYMYRKLA